MGRTETSTAEGRWGGQRHLQRRVGGEDTGQRHLQRRVGREDRDTYSGG